MPASPLTQLAEQLLNHSKSLDAYNEQHGLQPVSFEHGSFIDLPFEVEQQRKETISLAQDLKRLAQGPRDLLYESVYHFSDMANLRYVYRYKLPLHVPSEGDISYADLAAAAGVGERMCRRMVRMAMMNRIFVETTDGKVQHSAASRMLHDESGAMDGIGFLLEELFPASTKLNESLEKYPDSGEPNETAFNVMFNTSRPFYLELEAHQERARRFGSGIRWLTQSGMFANDIIAKGYDWSRFDHDDGLIVDVGGGQGAVARALASATKHMRIVVQDLPICAAQGEKALPIELKDRVSFQSHDFFSTQPIKGASVYFLRYILHNWSDKYAERILKALLPSLENHSRIIICEFYLPDRSQTAWTGKMPHNMDMLSAIGWNSVERTKSDWEQLFYSVDPGLKMIGATVLPGQIYMLIEAKLERTP